MSFSDLLSAADDATLEHLTGSEVVEYRDGEGTRTRIAAIFEAKHQTLSLGETGISAFAPSLFLRLSDLTSDPREDTRATFIVNGRHYAARDTQRDGQGCALVMLHLEDSDEDAA